MTRQPHDQFAKQYLKELLTLLGQVETSREVSPEVRQVDVWFVPAPSPPTEPQNLGLLGQMAATTSLFEPFRNAPTPVEVLDCQSKLNSVRSEMRRQARREGNAFVELNWPRLWILSPSCSASLLNGFGAKIDESGIWCKGVYFLPEFQKMALVAINEVPLTEETLWLRVLGKRGTQKRAVDELIALPKEHPFRHNILPILANWRINVERSENLSDEDRELLMNLSPAYFQWQEETLQQGRQQGRQEGQQQMVESFLRVRFGSVDEELSEAIASMLQLPPEELTRLLFNLSREELLERFGGQS